MINNNIITKYNTIEKLGAYDINIIDDFINKEGLRDCIVSMDYILLKLENKLEVCCKMQDVIGSINEGYLKWNMDEWHYMSEKLCNLYDEGNYEEIIEMFDLCNKTMDEVIKDLEEVKNGN